VKNPLKTKLLQSVYSIFMDSFTYQNPHFFLDKKIPFGNLSNNLANDPSNPFSLIFAKLLLGRFGGEPRSPIAKEVFVINKGAELNLHNAKDCLTYRKIGLLKF